MLNLPAVRLMGVKTSSYHRPFQFWTMDARGGHCWHLFLDWAPRGYIEDCAGLKMLLMGSFDKGGDPRQRGLVGLLLHGTPQSNGGRLYRVGVFRSAEDGQQLRGSGMKFFEECIDERVEVV